MWYDKGKSRMGCRMSIIKEFKEFAMKGNVMDLAIGVVVGGAFGKIITSLVENIIMPVVSVFTGAVSFPNLFITLDGKYYETLEHAEAAKAPIVNFGLFISNFVDFLIIALLVFFIVKQINRFKRKPVPAAIKTKECPYCRTNIHIEAIKCPNCTSVIK